MKSNTLHIIRHIFVYASILFVAVVDVIWCMVKNIPPISIYIIFSVLVLSISLRAFAKKKKLIVIILSDSILIAFSHWIFTHRTLSWVKDHIFMEPTFLITVIAILFILSDWLIGIKRKSIKNQT